MAYDDLLDHINEQMIERIVQRGDQFSNKDLLDYANSVTSSLEKAQKQISGIDEVPIIQFNQQNNTVIMETLDGESQQRVEDVINAILKKARQKNESMEVFENSSVYTNGEEENSNLNLKNDINFNEEGDD